MIFFPHFCHQVEDLTSRLQHIRHATNIEQTLSLISAVWEMSLEFEIDYLDIQVLRLGEQIAV